jgi:hypothetical protein
LEVFPDDRFLNEAFQIVPQGMDLKIEKVFGPLRQGPSQVAHQQKVGDQDGHRGKGFLLSEIEEAFQQFLFQERLVRAEIKGKTQGLSF